MAKGPMEHDASLFQVLLEQARGLDPAVRTGRMFGCPAVFRGRKMAACVYGDSIGLRVPEAIAAINKRSGRASPFQPFGKREMREWIRLDGGVTAVAAGRDLIAAAITFAEANNG